MWLITAISSALLFGLAGWWMKVSQMRGGSTRTLLLGLYASGTAGFGVHAALEGTWGWLANPQVWIAGVIIGAGSAWGNALFMKALHYGPASLTSPLTNMNIIIVIAVATWWYQEPLSATESVGIVLLLLAVVFIAHKRKEPLTIKERRWFLLVGTAILMFAIRNGGLKVTDELGLPSAPLLFIAYALSLCWFLIPTKETASRTDDRTGLWLGTIAGLFSYGGLQLYAAALATGQANLAAPIFATNSLVVAAGAIIVYKEKLTVVQWAAFAFTILGLIVIRL
ncbi:drug/metabolite transporter (DMT)-like permease [Paenibacillus endophyticus]|uniref:Drug/metabolite transporter (DMT)-like permease n=1 Tax=Paenibacillus endophyticus TaxID=1294268 RepID=A0A7W5G8G7_9BACL|nr:DMT family transporter [Paenibacillus endophyticus]MBB3150640.1 drug/metabolite transporter (DMT)-like permease [Paenibacillus endophyticus]